MLEDVFIWWPRFAASSDKSIHSNFPPYMLSMLVLGGGNYPVLLLEHTYFVMKNKNDHNIMIEYLILKYIYVYVMIVETTNSMQFFPKVSRSVNSGWLVLYYSFQSLL